MGRVLVAPETRLLLQATQPAGSVEPLETTLNDPAFDWNRLIALAQRENAVSALWQMLQRLPAGMVPHERATQLSRLALVSTFRMQHLEQRLVEVLRTLADANIEAVLLKGAALASTCYPSFAARPMGDIDLLVRKKDAQHAWQIMRDQGWSDHKYQDQKEFYEDHNHLPPLDDPSGTGLGLEIHTEITPSSESIRLTAETIWKRARPIELQGVRTWVPAQIDLILHLAIHFAWSHNLNSTGWRTFRDLHQIAAAGPIDWDEIVRAAELAHARTCCYWTLALARSLAYFNVDDRVLAALRPPRPRPVLQLLERHFATALFPDSRISCPSINLHEFLWGLALAPRWSGHGDARPWNRNSTWLQTRGATARPFAQRLSLHFSKAGHWLRYLRVLILRRPVPNHCRIGAALAMTQAGRVSRQPVD